MSTLKRCTAALQMLAYGGASNAVDEYIEIAESQTLKRLHMCSKPMAMCISGEYVRSAC